LSFNDIINQLGDFLLPSAQDLNESNPENLSNPTALCVAQGAIETFAELSSLLWTTAIAVTLYMSVFLRLTADEVKSSVKWYYVACYGIPVVMALIPFTFNGYGPAGAWCWIKERYMAMRFIAFYIPLVLAIAFNAVVYTMVVRLIKRTYTSGADQASAKQIDNTTRKLRLYPFILVIVWLPSLINRIVELSVGREVYGFFLAQKVFSSSQGMLNAIVYGFSRGVREALAQSLNEMCPALCPNKYQREIMRGVGNSDPARKGGGFWRNDSLSNVQHMDSAVIGGGGSAVTVGSRSSLNGGSTGVSKDSLERCDSVDFTQVDIHSAEAITNTPQLPSRGARVSKLSGASASEMGV
jgi:hypothetical protein